MSLNAPAPVVGPVDVELSGALNVKGAKLRLAKLTFLGDTVKLYDWDGKKFTEYDTLRQATLVEDRANLNKMQIRGISQMARDEAIGFDEEDCIATWDITVTGNCVDCS